MPGSVDHCWTTPSVCTDGDFDPFERHSYSPISDWWYRVDIEIWGPAICHACPAVSITSKDFTRFQIVLQNPPVKLEIQCAFIHSPINCICKIDFLWSILPVTISIVFHWHCSKNGSVWQTHSICNAYFIQHSFSLHHPLHVFWVHVLLIITLLLFRVDVLKFSRYTV